MLTSELSTVWLATNRRLAWLGAVVAVVLAVLTLLAAVAAGQSAGGVRLVLVGLACGAAFSTLLSACLTLAAFRPAVSAEGDWLLVRLGPGRTERLPLTAVEVFFLGSQPLDHRGGPADADEASFRVGTLVVRVAERATAVAKRSGGGPWAAWENGYLVIDGRWTEPLTVETLRRINGRLIVAKRAAGEAGPDLAEVGQSCPPEGCCQ
jgi:hypothetical protein